MIWTAQQKKAIYSREKNLLVAAAAGSGKTAVLVERITQILIEGKCDVNEMLIVTFTNAAAQEMRSRIQKKIEEKISEENDSELLAKLERQSILLSGASVMTFHAFCMSVIKRNFSKIDLDPKFREGNEHELNILKQEVIEELFEEKYSDANFVKFSDEFGGNVHGDEKIYKIILDLHNASCSRPYPAKWLDSLAKKYERPENKNWTEILFDSALENVKNVLENSLSICGKCLEECDELLKLSKQFDGITENFSLDSDLIKNLLTALNDWDKLFSLLGNLKFKTWSSKKIPDDLKFRKENLKKIRDDYKKKIENLKDIVTKPKSEIILEIENLSKPVRQLIELTKEFDKKFSAAKRERGIIDFSDMEHLALEIFNTDEKTAENYRKKFKIIMVDEYQDTNDVQEEIISKIVRKNNFFAVGDVKQSIYKFRNASPEIFLQKYKNYPTHDDCERIDLSKNFRSRKQIIDAVNEIFCHLMTENATEIDYNEDAKLNFGATENYLPANENIFDEPTEFLIVSQEKIPQDGNSQDGNSQDDNENEAEELDKLEKEIQIIADKINFMIKSEKKVWDKDKKIYRPLNFRDIVILLRSTDGKATKIIDILAKNKIPAYAEDKGGYFKAQEVQTILNLLNVLDNSRQDIPLAAVMMSIIGGFSAEDLAQLRVDGRDFDLYTLIFAKSAENNELGEKCRDFLIKLNYWREISRQVSVSELLSKIYRETGFYDYFDNATGKVARANLRVLIDRAADYEKTAFRGLSRFIQFIKKMRDLNNDLSSARTLGENENIVRVMTIHKSKGLEFPVVFVAELGKRFNLQDLSKNVIAHRNLGLGICRVIEGSHGLNLIPTFPQKVIKNKMKLENLAEELRILYVAFTRAKEKLILIGTCDSKNLEKFSEVKEISAQQIQSANNPLDWLLAVKNFASKVIKFEIVEDSKIKISDEKISEEVEEKISEQIEKLPPSPLENIPAKVSVTEIKRRLEEIEDDEFAEKIFDAKKSYRRPNFIQKKSLSPAEIGTLTHSVMQHLNLSEKLDEKNISAQIDEMVEKKIFDEVQGEKLKSNSANIAKFFSSPVGKNLLSAKKIYRELPFSYYVAAETIGGGKIFTQAAGEKIFIQGIIDLLFQNSSGEWILLDYKTDRENSDEHFIKEYREQIRLYVQAVENILNLKISEKYLYLLNGGREIKI
ncbi:MAG: helicase-exonuclease AddAB subunit AddA [Selenomonadaceae bacterium]|nr:helicase-exonuclease AddAB subunit AddA [Selenomonadaceae bacterium]